MKISKIFYFLIYIIYINLLISRFLHQINPYQIIHAATRLKSTGNFSSTEHTPFYLFAIEEVRILMEKCALKVFNNASKEKKTRLLMDRKGLKNAIHDLMSGIQNTYSEAEKQYVLSSVIYKIEKESIELLEDQNDKEIMRKCFDIKDKYDSEEEDRWKELIKHFSSIFEQNKMIRSMNNTEKDNLWKNWFKIMEKEWLERKINYIELFNNMIKTDVPYNYIAYYFQQVSGSWESYKNLYMMMLWGTIYDHRTGKIE